MKNIIAALITCGLFAAQANAATGTIVIDDFNSDQQAITNTALGTVTSTSLNAIRTLSSNLIANMSPVNSSVEVTSGTDGILDITNGTGENSIVDVTWSGLSFNLPTNALANFFFEIVSSDGNPTHVSFTLNGTSLFTADIPANTTNQTISFSVDPALLNAGGTLDLQITGATGWDMAVDAFGVSWTTPSTSSNVPEPTSIALLSAGLAGLGAMRRRKQKQAQ
jgi:PEP-CTERM motif